MRSTDWKNKIEEHSAGRPSDELLSSVTQVEQLGFNNPLWSAIAQDGSKYVLKWSKNNNGLVPEINEREELTSLLGRVLSLPVVPAWSIQSILIKFEPSHQDEVVAPLIRDKCVVQPLLHGKSIALRQAAAAIQIAGNPSVVADLLAFMHWIGDEDRGINDVMIVEKRLVLIDNGLCGPSLVADNPLRSYHPDHRAYNPTAILKKCYPGKASFVAFIFRDCELWHGFFASPGIIERIAQLPEEAIIEVVRFCGVDPRVAGELIQRKFTLAQDYSDWFKAVSNLLAPPS